LKADQTFGEGQHASPGKHRQLVWEMLEADAVEDKARRPVRTDQTFVVVNIFITCSPLEAINKDGRQTRELLIY
jgi:hypothetical protein